MTKITRPTAVGSLPRERLFRRLDEARDRPVIWVSAPAGFGKTTLVAGYAESRGLPYLWYQIDPGDADLSSFFYYLSLAGKNAAPRRRKPLPLLTPEYLLGIPEFSGNFFEDLFGRLKPASILVFDNCQEVSDDASLYGALLAGLARLPEGMTLILVSRSDPPPAFARLRANQDLDILGWGDLRLTLKEFQGIVHRQGLGEQQEEALRHLHARMDGWAAGLQLVLEGVRTQSIEPARIAEATPEEVFHYFAGEVFGRLDEETGTFLLQTSFLPNMTPNLARDLTGNSGAERILAYLYRHNQFTERRANPRPTYQYHPLFREFLAARARDSLAPEEVADTQRRAAALLVAAGQAEDAIALLREAEDWPSLVALILQQAPALISQGRSQTLEGWLRSLPREAIETNPWLLYWAGVCRGIFAPDESRGDLERAFDLFEEQADGPGLLLAWSGVIDSYLWDCDSYKPMDEWVSRFERGPARYWPSPSPEVTSRVTASMLSAISLRQPRHPDREAWIRQGLSLTEGNIDGNAKIQILVPLVLDQLFAGDLTGAGQTIKRFHTITRSEPVSPLGIVFEKDAETFFNWLAGRFEESLQSMTAGIELAASTGVHVLDFFLLGHGAAAALSAGDTQRAARILREMATCLNRGRAWEKTYYHVLAGWNSLLHDDVPGTALHAGQALTCGEDAGNPYTIVFPHILTAYSKHALDLRDETEEHLSAALCLSRAAHSPLNEFNCHLATAELALDRGDATRALASLEKGLGIGKQRGYFNWYFSRPAAAAKLCIAALDGGVAVAYVQELIRRRGLAPDRPPLGVADWPWPLRVYTLGKFEIVHDGNPIRWPGRAPRRPLAMLKALIVLGGRNVPESHIVDALWPDADATTARQSFDTTLHRLRRLVGVKEALPLRDGELTLDPNRCWVDAWAFERVLVDAEETWAESSGKGDRRRTVSLLTKAVALYAGLFLPQDADELWSIRYREHLRSKFRRGVERLCRYLEEIESWEAAAESYRKALEVDPLAEAFYRRLMRCHQRLGRSAEAVAVYERCRKVLAAELGVRPSAETEAVLQEVRAG